MKAKLSILVLFLCVSNAFAQVNIGKSRSPINLWVSSHKQQTFDKLKDIETVFIVPNSISNKEALKSAIKEIWTINEITFIEQETYDEEPDNLDPLKKMSTEYISPDYMVIRLIDNVYSKTKSGGFMGPQTRTVGAYISFKFRASIFENIKEDKKGNLKYDDISVAEIFFTPNIKLRQDVSYSAGGKLKIGGYAKKNDEFGEEAGFYNYEVGYVKNYFQELNRRLMDAQNLKMEDGVEKEDKLAELNGNTLYVPKWSLLKYNAMAATYGKTRTAEELFGKYGHKYEIISSKEINDKILNGEDFYYLMHTQFNQKRIISVIHSTTGEIIYLNEDGGYNIKDSDIKNIGKLISKAS